MKINEIIKEKRLALGYTQEQLAKYLNLTTPAVNKWERGVTYPDITILPALARVLKTDLNTLLSFKDDLSDYEVGLFLNEIAKMEFEQAYQFAINKINEYPTCYSLIINVVALLQGMLEMSKVSDVSKYHQEIDELIERALQSDDLTITNQARVLLISKHLKAKDYIRVEELINELPHVNFIDKKEQLIKLSIAKKQYKEAAKLQEEAILNSANKLSMMLLTLMDIAINEERDDDAKEIADIYQEICTSLDLWKYTTYLAHFQYYSIKKNRIKCLKTLVPMLKSITNKWEINNSPLYRHINTKKVDSSFPVKMKEMMIDSIRNDQELDFLQSKELDEVIKEVE